MLWQWIQLAIEQGLLLFGKKMGISNNPFTINMVNITLAGKEKDVADPEDHTSAEEIARSADATQSSLT